MVSAVIGSWVLMAAIALPSVQEPLPPGALRMHGTVDAAIRKSVENWTLGDVPYHAFADFFRKGRPQFALGEMWGKFIRAAAYQYRYTGDERIRVRIEDAVRDIIATQRENGSISCDPPSEQPGGRKGDLWERKYVMLGLERSLELVRRDKTAMEALVRHADCLISQIGPPPKVDVRSQGWSANHIESSTLLEPFVNLYAMTKERRFLDFAAYIVKSGGADGYDLIRQACDNVPPHKMGGPYPKAYEMLSFFEGLLEYHRYTGDETSKRACINLFNNILTNEMTIIGNGGGDRPFHPRVLGEAWDHTAFEQTNPAMKRMMETCAGVTWLKFCGRINALTGNPTAADAMERYIYNGLLGAMTPQGDGFSYVNLLNGLKTTNKGWGWIFPSGPVTCCNLNGPIGLAMIPYYAVMQGTDGPVVNFYENFEATVRGGADDVKLVAPTDFANGDIWRLEVNPTHETSFPMKLRIPRWSERTVVRVGGKQIDDVKPGAYLTLDRTWRRGDVVEITFDWRARRIRAPHGTNPTGDNFEAVVCGPFVLARDENTDSEFDSEVELTADADGFVSARRVTPSISGHRLEFEVKTADGHIRMCDYASVNSWQGKRVMTWLPTKGVKVSSFGYDQWDSTRFLQAALDSGARKIVVDRQRGPWISQPLFGRSNQEIVFERGVEIVAKKGAFLDKRDCLLKLSGVTNVTIRGGSGSTIRMWREDYAKPPYARSEWRHALAINDAKNIKVVGMTFGESGGDGVIVSGKSEGIELLDCVMTRNFRQGLSVISCHDLLVENCVFEKTKGTNPESGVDLEPDSPQDRLTSCIFRNCKSIGNAGNGFCISPVQLDSSSTPIGVRFENCISENDGTGVQIALFREKNYPTGRVVFAGCEFKSPKRGCLIVNKPAGTMDVTFANCKFLDAEEMDFLLQTEQWDFDPPDGIRFSNVLVRQPKDRPLFSFPVPGYGREVSSLTGRLVVESPLGKRTVQLTPKWCAENIPRGGGEDPLPRVKADLAQIWPHASDVDEMRALKPVAVAHWQRYVFRVDTPRTVRLNVRQILGRTKIPSPIPLKINCIGGTFRKEIPMPKDGSGTVTFKADEVGYYAMNLDGYHSRFIIDAANVPVAVDAMSRYREFCLAPGETSFGFSFDVKRGSTFSLLTRVIYAGDEYACELFDHSGRKICGEKLSCKWQTLTGGADGRVRAVFTRDGAGVSRGGNIFIDLTGIPGLLHCDFR